MAPTATWVLGDASPGKAGVLSAIAPYATGLLCTIARKHPTVSGTVILAKQLGRHRDYLDVLVYNRVHTKSVIMLLTAIAMLFSDVFHSL